MSELKNIYAAMAKAFPKLEAATKDKTNPHFKSKYADLSAVMDAIKPALQGHGLFFIQISSQNDNGAEVSTVLCHESGEEKYLGTVFIPASKRDAHGFGSALTYARRYALQTAFGIPAEDDDGNAAVAAPSKPVVLASDDELAEIWALIDETDTDAKKFCQYLKIDKLDALPADRFEFAKAALMKKVQK